MQALVSTKGQVVIPKAMRDRHGIQAGTVLEVIDQGETIVLRRVDRDRRFTVDDLLALPHYYAGPRKSDAEIADALDADVRRRWSEP